ncbi:DNA cytosine methyltransferase [Thalassoglobus sp.]|uniref:DNA cytosine methyltransferase n=1 Tax=Thalassoglobus sp. TaxID=2795869 RepID=UPI003AA90C8A
MEEIEQIPVIDIFAGPGGLGEGFSSFRTRDGYQPFRISLSVEKDPRAHETLKLRSFLRQFPVGAAPEEYYQVLRGELKLEDLPERLQNKPNVLAAWKTAEKEAVCAELGASEESHKLIGSAIQKSVKNRKQPWVLIGGPPCQAYSIAGRARNKGIADYRIEDDHRSSLYQEYLRIIAEHWPSVFVMENVKGLLSATVNNQKIFEKIITDLESPLEASGEKRRVNSSQRYRIVPLVKPRNSLVDGAWQPGDFLVASEHHGIPQIRHRVFLIGIREDLGDVELPFLTPSKAPSVAEIVGGLPPLRSGLSRKRVGSRYINLKDSPELWRQTLIEQTVRSTPEDERRWLKSVSNGTIPSIRDEILSIVSNLDSSPEDRGSEFVSWKTESSLPSRLRDWYLDLRLGGVCNHSTRGHMDTDLARYLFATCYAKVNGVSPKLSQFPADLQPNHKNASSGDFDDRFRVQIAGKPSSTISGVSGLGPGFFLPLFFDFPPSSSSGAEKKNVEIPPTGSVALPRAISTSSLTLFLTNSISLCRDL